MLRNPAQGVLPSYLRRHRLKKRSSAAPASETQPKPPGAKYEASDFEFLEGRSNASPGGASHVAADDERLASADPCLRAVSAQISSDSVVVALVSPQLLCQALSLVPQPWSLKLSTDGTCRLMFENYALLTVGINVKEWSLGEDGHQFAFRSQYLPLCFALANSEDNTAYAHTVATIMLKVAGRCGLELDERNMHRGIEKARQAIAPGSARLSDWAHVTGATSEGPSGLVGLLQKHLTHDKADELLPWLLQWCRISKPFTSMLFHVAWTSIFQRLDAEGQSAAKRALQQQYFTKQQAPANSRESIWDAPWRSGPDRIMPGTDAAWQCAQTCLGRRL